MPSSTEEPVDTRPGHSRCSHVLAAKTTIAALHGSQLLPQSVSVSFHFVPSSQAGASTCPAATPLSILAVITGRRLHTQRTPPQSTSPPPRFAVHRRRRHSACRHRRRLHNLVAQRIRLHRHRARSLPQFRSFRLRFAVHRRRRCGTAHVVTANAAQAILWASASGSIGTGAAGTAAV